MAAPTITTITPSSGHSGGGLIEIIGTNFRQLSAPAATGPVEVPPPSVEVLFGTTAAEDVQILSDTRLLVITPGLDPFKQVDAFTADAGADTLTASAHGLLDGYRVALSSDGTLPAPLLSEDTNANPVGYYVISATANTFQLATTLGGAAVDLTDVGAGAHSVESDGYYAITINNLRLQPAKLETTNAEPFALADGQTFELNFDGGQTQVVIFNTADFSAIASATAEEVSAVINADIRGGRSLSSSSGSKVTLESDTTGASALAEVTGGTAAAALGFPAGAVFGADEVEPEPGETVVAARAFAPLRPDLSTESHLATVLGQFILEVRRQILENVSWTTHTDYDDDTGDMLNLAYLAKLPAIVIAGLSAPENRLHAVQESEDFEINDPAGADGDFYTTRPPVVVDLVGSIVGITDNDMQLLNMLQAVRVFFKKNPRLSVPRAYGNDAAGKIRYDMEGAINSEMAISPQGANSNVQFFGFDFRIIGVRLEDMPGLPASQLPGVPGTQAAEPVIALGKTATAVTITTESKG